MHVKVVSVFFDETLNDEGVLLQNEQLQLLDFASHQLWSKRVSHLH